MDVPFSSIIYFAILKIRDYLTSAVQLIRFTYIFTPRLNQHFEMFGIGFDNHPLASQSNMTTAQLWLYGMANYLGEGEPPEEDMSSFGIDCNVPLP